LIHAKARAKHGRIPSRDGNAIDKLIYALNRYFTAVYYILQRNGWNLLLQSSQ
jgi:hypothetical protein